MRTLLTPSQLEHQSSAESGLAQAADSESSAANQTLAQLLRPRRPASNQAERLGPGRIPPSRGVALAHRGKVFALVSAALCLLSWAGRAQNAFVQTNLVSNLPGMAAVTDTNLVNPWGISFSATSPFWIADNGPGLSTVYNSTGGVQSLVVTIPPPAGQSGPAAPSGTIANSVAGFLGTSNATAHFLFSTEDGTISAWSGGTAAVLKVDYSASYAVFKGLAAGVSGTNDYLYATDFHNGQIDVFDTNYDLVTLPGSFTDTNLPAGYAPFGIQNINGQLFVSYALQDAAKHDDVGGPGHGYIDLFDTAGNLIKSFAAQGSLNSPWGMALAPAGFGPFAGDILIGNFGDGRINAFDPKSGEWLAALEDPSGNPFSVPGLWAIAFGNGHNGGSAQDLYFTAGIDAEANGLFGRLSAVYPSPTNGISFVQSNLVWTFLGLPPSPTRTSSILGVFHSAPPAPSGSPTTVRVSRPFTMVPGASSRWSSPSPRRREKPAPPLPAARSPTRSPASLEPATRPRISCSPLRTGPFPPGAAARPRC